MNNGSSGRRRGRAGQHDLVGGELGAALQQVAVILVVKHLGRDLIQVLQCAAWLAGRAVPPRELTLNFAECVRT